MSWLKTQPYSSFVHPFDGWPETIQIKDGWRIRARHMTAKRAKATKETMKFCKAMVFLFVLLAAISHETSNLMLMMIAIAAGFGLLWWDARSLFCKRTDIEMKGRTLRIGRGKPFDLNYPHQFDMAPHPKRPALEFRERTKDGIPLYSYYDDTWVIRMHYGGTPVPLMEVYFDTNAAEMVARLQAIDQILQETPKMEKKKQRPGD